MYVKVLPIGILWQMRVNKQIASLKAWNHIAQKCTVIKITEKNKKNLRRC